MKKRLLQYALLTLMMGVSILFITGFNNPEIKNDKTTSGGELTFTVRTVTANGTYSPKHVLAIWIEDADGFVKTRKAMANQRKQYLYTWHAASAYNVVDAITGPTLNSHQTHTVTWNCEDLSGNIVPDGVYTVWVEFTDKHAQGPLYTLDFTKGTEAMSLSPADQTYFKDIQLDFVPLVADFSADITTICKDETVTFTDLSVGATSWSWSFGSGANPNTASTQGPHIVTYNTSGEKTVSLTINASLTETKSNFITVNLVPTVDFIFSGNNLTVDFTNNSINASTYLWEFGDGESSTDENPTHVYSSAGAYMVTLIADNLNCLDSLSQEVLVPITGISDNRGSNEYFAIFPNPSSGLISIVFNQVPAEETVFSIYNSAGKIIEEIQYDKLIESSVKFDLSDQAKGIYFIKYKSAAQIFTEKILIR